MTTNFTKRLVIALLTAIFSFGFCFASDEEITEKDIPIKPIKDTSGPHKPETPSLIQLSAKTDRDGVIVTSSDSVVAQIKVTDTLNGDCYFNRTVSINPTYRCALPGIREQLTLHIIIDDIEYVGYFELNW